MTKQKTKQISVSEYASKINPQLFRNNRKNPNAPITEEAVRIRVRRGIELPEVIKADKIGKVLVLTVKNDF